MLSESEQKMYQEFLAGKTPWVLFVAGIGGNGKTTFLRHLHKQTPENALVVTLDFASLLTDYDDLNVIIPLKVLEQFAWQARSHCSEQMVHIFEESLHDCHVQLSQASPQMMYLASRASAGSPNLERGTNIMRDILYHTRALVTEAFYAQMRTLKLSRLVIMFDNCELLSESRWLDTGRWILNVLLPELRSRMLQKYQCYAVIASSIPLQLEVIHRQDQKFYILPVLSDVVVAQSLQEVGMQEATLIRNVQEIIYGHASCLSIVQEIWRDNRPRDFYELRMGFRKKALNEFIRRSIESRLRTPFRELTHYGALLRSFNLPLLRAVFPELDLDFEQFDHFICYPHIISAGHYRYRCHDLLRSILADIIWHHEDHIWKQYHKRALDYFMQTAPHSPDRYYHALAYDKEQGMLEWLQALRTAQTREQRDALLSVVQDKGLECTLARQIVHASLSQVMRSDGFTAMLEAMPNTSLWSLVEAFPIATEAYKEQNRMNRTISILFLAANPKDTPLLRLDEEVRSIDLALRQAEFRDLFDIKQHRAVRVADLQGYLLRHKPDIVHFSGHGSPSSEIILEDINGQSHPVVPRALSQIFSILKDNIRCVVLNACYSEQQAQAIAQHIECVVGMSKAIGDTSAISFAAAFYQALGYGRSVKTAFDLGCAQIDLENLEEQDIPTLLAVKCNPADVTFVG